jgi:hypothetical protein
MEQEKEPTTEYMKGFNHGYLFTQYEPELAKALLRSSNGQGDYFKGLQEGKEQYDNEKALEFPKDEKLHQGGPDKFRDYLPSWLRDPSNKDDPGPEPDMDFDIEPDRS